MPPVQIVSAVIALHVVTGSVWAAATLVTIISGRIGRVSSGFQVGSALVGMAAGIYLWHALHAADWGTTEHILVVGSFCAFIAFGLQAAIAIPTLWNSGAAGERIVGPAWGLYGVAAAFLAVAATAMVLSRYR